MNSTTAKYINKGIEYEENNEFHRAIEIYKKALEMEPNNLTALIKMGEIYSFINDIDRAMQIFTIVLDLDPKNRVALEYRRLFGEKC